MTLFSILLCCISLLFSSLSFFTWHEPLPVTLNYSVLRTRIITGLEIKIKDIAVIGDIMNFESNWALKEKAKASSKAESHYNETAQWRKLALFFLVFCFLPPGIAYDDGDVSTRVKVAHSNQKTSLLERSALQELGNINQGTQNLVSLAGQQSQSREKHRKYSHFNLKYCISASSGKSTS